MHILARRVQIVVTCVLTAACGSKSAGGGGPAPTTPSPTVTVARLTSPTPDSPANQFQLNTLRPTLTVTNGTSDQPQGTRTYEFQISDRADFTSLAAGSSLSVKHGTSFLTVATKTGVAEGSGQTTFTPDEDLQPTTRFYWRARLAQGTATSDWSEVRSFKTKLVGFNRAGELYDPLIHGETVGVRVGSTDLRRWQRHPRQRRQFVCPLSTAPDHHQRRVFGRRDGTVRERPWRQDARVLHDGWRKQPL